jgi:two-component system, OmpR family, sensor kinase
MAGALSLRTRLLAGMGVVAVVLAAVALTLTTTTRRHLIEQVDDRLVAADRTRPGPPALTSSDAPGDRFSEYYEYALDDDTLLLLTPPNVSSSEGRPALDVDTVAMAPPGEPFTVGAEDGSGQFRVIVRAPQSGIRYAAALSLADVNDTVRQLVTMELLATAAILAVLGAVTWWVIRLGIRPIKQMTATATTIADSDTGLARRVETPAPGTEAGELGAALNHMLDRLETAFDARAESQERLRQFVADASHELRTPVTTIRGYAELYRIGGLDSGPELDEAMRRTEQEAVRMARLVDDLLTIAKLGAGRPLETHPVELTALVDDAASDARATDRARPITVTHEAPVVVLGDEDRLRQVIANIVGNALVHTPPATPIELRTRRDDDQAVVEIVDLGPGMPPEVASRITERFYRADPARSRHRGGSGLGLSIADVAVAAHGGTIEVESELGRGTLVRVRLPLAGRA